MELWKDIPNFEGLYQASSLGNIRSINHIRKNGTNEYIQEGRILKFNKNPNGYLQVRLSKNGKAKTYRVNRLIALTFIDNPYSDSSILFGEEYAYVCDTNYKFDNEKDIFLEEDIIRIIK